MKISRIIFGLLMIGALLLPTGASAQVSCMGGLFCFGGVVLSYVSVCDEGIWLILGMPNPGTYMWYWGGNAFFANYMVPYPTMNMAGYAYGYLTCTVGIYTIGGGIMILAHGGSL